MNSLNIFIAFGAGLLSFFSPCTLPIYPSFLAYLTGLSTAAVNDGNNQQNRLFIMLHAVFFLLGFSLIFFVLGFTISWFGDFFLQYREILRMVSATLILFMGLFLLGLFQPTWLLKERKFIFSRTKVSYAGSTIVGLGFAAGWTPCTGPILASVLSIALTSPQLGMLYLLAYVLGFALPFLALASFISKVKWLQKYTSTMQKVGGVLLVLFGILLYTDMINRLSQWLL